MSELRVLTDAELDIVGGGSNTWTVTAAARRPTSYGGGIQLVEESIVDILFRLLEPKAQPAALKDNKR